MSEASPAKAYGLHLGIIALLFVLSFLLPEYYHGLLARIMVLAVFAMGYNMLFGYVGLLSLGHAMFFAAGLYGAGLSVIHLGWNVPLAFLGGIACGALLSLVIGLLALRTTGVAFMIVTMMFAQVFYLLILYFATWTGGDQGQVVPQPARVLTFGATSLDLTNPTVRYMSALVLFSLVLLVTLAIVRSRYGRVLVAIAAEFRKHQHGGFASVVVVGLNFVPQHPGETVGARDGVEVERVGAPVRHIHVPEIHQDEARSELAHWLR